MVEAVVRHRIVEPAEQARILAATRQRLARRLERPAPTVAQPRRAERDRSA